MRQVPRFFNTAGPIMTDIHYYVDPLSRINLEEVETLIYQRKYFVLHAPRQTGKTSCLLALRDYLNARGEFVCVYANIEAGQAFRNNALEVERRTIGTIASETDLVLGSGSTFARNIHRQLSEENPDNATLSGFLTRLCEALDKPRRIANAIYREIQLH